MLGNETNTHQATDWTLSYLFAVPAAKRSVVDPETPTPRRASQFQSRDPLSAFNRIADWMLRDSKMRSGSRKMRVLRDVGGRDGTGGSVPTPASRTRGLRDVLRNIRR